uniref:Uncharacterized protein n=1 Tax=Magallana gigas TaxID=29159 RepID=K1RWT6_MAGGI
MFVDQSRVMESLSGIPTPGTEKPQQGNQCLLKLMSPPELLHSHTLTGVEYCGHISCVTSDWVWVSDGNNLILTDTTGDLVHRVEDSRSGLHCRGFHTVNSESELIYIHRKHKINKLSKDMKTTITFIKRTYTTWRPQCLYWSPSTGDLLVGMCYIHTGTAKVTRYNQSGQLTRTIQHDNTGRGLYRYPHYITENNNGDVVVSDRRAVVVTEPGGRHRFSYTGPPSGLGLEPGGICTDALSHILVYDGRTKTVQMLDKDGTREGGPGQPTTGTRPREGESKSGYKARLEQLSTALELERAKLSDLQGAIERVTAVNQTSERVWTTNVLKDELKQERLVCHQKKNEIDKIQLQKLDITRHYEHEHDQVSQLKSEHELLRS